MVLKEPFQNIILFIQTTKAWQAECKPLPMMKYLCLPSQIINFKKELEGKYLSPFRLLCFNQSFYEHPSVDLRRQNVSPLRNIPNI